MDVTLERVQFKFASIIGELCSKPVILSQFAIWVDLRLAEYKLKGAISLDCSGDKPDPDWLKGMKDSDESSPDYPGSEHHRSPARGRSINHNRSFGETTDGSHIKEIDIPNRVVAESEFGDSATIVIKNDSDDERQGVFPTGLHVHESRNYNHRRKRSRESGLDIGEDGLYTVMHPKMLKSSEPSMLSQSSNQSLMSIIGGQDSVIEASPVSLEDSQRDIDLGMAIQLQESQHMGDNSSFIAGRPSSHATSTITQSSQEADISFNSPQSKSTPERRPMPVQDERGIFPAAGGLDHIEWRSATDFMGPFYRHPKTSQTLKNTSSAGGIFRRWLLGEHHREERLIPEIPLEVLDGYLSDFFKTIKKRDGRNYNPESFNTLKLSLNRYLNKEGIDSSTLRSAAFFRSRQAFLQRKLDLSANLGQNKPPS